MSAPPEVLVLGPLVARVGDAEVDLGPGRRRAVLAAMAADAGRIVPLPALLDRVWDGEPTDAATTALHAHVSRLRRAFRDAGAGAADVPIVTDPPGYRLALAPGALDAERFADALRRARSRRDAGDAAGASREARDGLALWRGRPYADVQTEHAAAEAERLLGLRRAAQELAVEADLALGRHADLIDELRALLTDDPYAEAMHGALMLALHRAGRQAEALAQYAQVQRMLAEELGTDPGRALQRLHARLLAADPDLDAPTTARTPEEPPAVEIAADAHLVGREVESARLREAVRDAWATASRTVALVGEAGIGKTRLLEHVAASTRAPDVLQAWGRSWQHEGAPRLWPWIQLLRGLAEQAGPASTAAALAGGTGAVLAAVVPELVPEEAVRGAAAGGARDLEGSELRLLDAMTTAIRRFAAERRVLLLLEDLHWADPASRRMTEYLVTHLAGPGVAVLATVRWPSDDAVAATSGLLAGMARGGRSMRLDLRGFDRDEVRRFVADRTGADIDPATAEALHERTDGNPFFVGELVRLILQDGTPDVSRTAIPDSVREVVLARLERLAAPHRAVLDAAAVVGREFDPTLLRAAVGTSEDEVDDALDAATATGMISSDVGADAYRFGHALVQQALLEAIGPAKRRRLHSRIAVELGVRHASRIDSGATDALVHHLAAAGSDAELAEAARLLVAQADASRQRGDVGAAEAALLSAVDAAARIRGPEAASAELAARVRLYSLYTLSTPSAGTADAHRARAVELARAAGRPHELLMTLAARFSQAAILFDLEWMRSVAEEYAVLGEATGDLGLVVGGPMARAHHLLYEGALRDSLAASRAALALLDGAEDVPPGVFPLHPAWNLRWYEAAALRLLGDPAGSDAVVDGMLRLPAPDSHTPLYVDILLAMLYATTGEVAAAEAAVERAAAARKRVDIAEGALYGEVVAAWAADRRSPGTRVDALIAMLQSTAALPTMGSRPMLRFLAADLLVRAGRAAEARQQAAAGLAEIAVSGETLSEPWLLRLDADAAEALGEPEAAAAGRLRAREAAERLGVPLDPERREVAAG